MPVSPRTIRRFTTRQTLVEKVVDRRLGFESPDPPTGWKWDLRHMMIARNVETLPFPGLKGSHLLSLPRGYWQNGPLRGSDGDELKVEKIKKVFK